SRLPFGGSGWTRQRAVLPQRLRLAVCRGSGDRGSGCAGNEFGADLERTDSTMARDRACPSARASTDGGRNWCPREEAGEGGPAVGGERPGSGLRFDVVGGSGFGEFGILPSARRRRHPDGLGGWRGGAAVAAEWRLARR